MMPAGGVAAVRGQRLRHGSGCHDDRSRRACRRARRPDGGDRPIRRTLALKRCSMRRPPASSGRKPDLTPPRTREDFAAVTAAIGRGRYQLSAVRACLDCTSTPEQKQPCFFDPAHGPAERLIAWTPPDRDPRTVPVCEADAELVEADEQPTPRNVVVGDDVIPYWDAPDYFVSWFSGYFESVDGCAPEDLLGRFSARCCVRGRPTTRG